MSLISVVPEQRNDITRESLQLVEVEWRTHRQDDPFRAVLGQGFETEVPAEQFRRSPPKGFVAADQEVVALWVHYLRVCVGLAVACR